MDNEVIAKKAYSLLAKEPLSIGALSQATECKRRRLVRILTKDGRFQHADGGIWSVNAEAGQKVFKRRDSATAYLKKLGVSKDAYDKYIKEVQGAFTVRAGGGPWLPLGDVRRRPKELDREAESLQGA